MRAHVAFALLFALAAPALFHFAHSDVVASLGDDSVSYLLLARHMLDPNDVLVRPWVAYHAHFPPLFPALLAVSGGARSLATAHAVVAALAVLSLVLVYRYAARILDSNAAALWVVALFVLSPTAWISISGILSESLFLFATLGALHYYETRVVDGEAPPRRWLIFGTLLGATLMTRSAGAMLLLAYGMHVAMAMATPMRSSDRVKRLLPIVPVLLCAIAWVAWRPSPQGYNYATVTSHIFNAMLLADPMGYVRSAAEVAFGGWIRTFTADSDVHWLPKLVFGVFGLLALAGAVRRARANRLDGWYVLASVTVVYLWLFSEDNARRLLYPIVPIMLIHAALFLRFLAQGRAIRAQRMLGVAFAILPLLLCLPAWWLVQTKSLDGEAVYPGLPYRYSDMTEYYTTVSAWAARGLAAKHAATLGGLESVHSFTPPGARILWVRPEYPAILGGRHGLPLLQGATEREFVTQLRQSGGDYVLVSTLLKAGMDDRAVSPQQALNWVLQIAPPVFSLPSRVGEGIEVAVFRLDPAAMDERLRALP